MTSQTIIIRGGIHREIDLANAASRLAKLDPAMDARIVAIVDATEKAA